MISISKMLAAGSCVLAFSLPSLAGEAEDRLINRIVEAYGGDTLTSARSMLIQNHNKIVPFGQSSSPTVADISDGRTRLAIDFEGERKSFSNWNRNRAGTFYTQTVFDDDDRYTLDHVTRTRTENPNLTFMTVGGGTVRTVDVALVTVLLANREAATLGEPIIIKGKPHQTLTFPMEGSPDLTIYMDEETGLLSRMTRENPQFGELSYNFSDHVEEGGIRYASRADFQIAGQANTISYYRRVQVNAPMAPEFSGGNGYQDQGAQIDRSGMIFSDLGEGIYYVGQNIGYSIFVDAGDYFVASGGYTALTDRFNALKENTGIDKPLRYQIVTHHHSDHVGGIPEAAALGATFVTVAEDVPTLQATLEAPLGEDRYMLVEGRTSLADGKVEIYDITTAHADHYLLVYLPEINRVFSADHFGTALEEGLPPANRNMTTFRTAVEALNLDIDGFIDAHSPRMLTMADLRAATAGYREVPCPNNASICRR